MAPPLSAARRSSSGRRRGRAGGGGGGAGEAPRANTMSGESIQNTMPTPTDRAAARTATTPASRQFFQEELLRGQLVLAA